MASSETVNDLIDRIEAECTPPPAVETKKHGPTTAPATLDAARLRVAKKLQNAARGVVDDE